MGRIIDLEFNDKKYAIEFNRASVVKFMQITNQDEDDTIEMATNLVKCGLLKHHQNDLPSDDDIVSWLFAMGDDLEMFVRELQASVQEVITALENDRKSKNLKWGVRK